jgi:ribosomal-protein-alanine N-acetyltransferase
MDRLFDCDSNIFLRLVHPSDAAELADFHTRNREPAAEFEAVRPAEFFTFAGQQNQIQSALDLHSQDRAFPCLICFNETGKIVGRANLSNIVRGVFQNANLGYIIDHAHNGRGIATKAVGLLVNYAFTGLNLHRLEAATLLHNYGSQRVLEKNGFRREGLAKDYLFINGKWQDHFIFARTSGLDSGG